MADDKRGPLIRAGVFRGMRRLTPSTPEPFTDVVPDEYVVRLDDENAAEPDLRVRSTTRGDA